MPPKTTHVRKLFTQGVRGSRVVADHVLDGCIFRTCHVHSNNHDERPLFRHLVVKNCRNESTDAHGAIFEDCEIDGLRTNRLSMVTGCAFRHVVLRGDLGQFLIRASKPDGLDLIDAANLAYYEGVDWALDIREAKAATLDIRDVPLELIRRTPESQAIIRRARLSYKEMRKLKLGPTATQLLSTFLPYDPDRKLFVAGARSKNYRDWLEAFEQLRAAELAE